MSRYSELFKIRTNDLDTYDRVKPYVYLDFFQDVAGHHADILGVGYEACKKENIAWVLMKNRLEVIKESIQKIEDFGEKEILTLIYGKDVSQEEVDELISFIQSINHFIEIYPINGNQDIYSYIIGLE